MVYQSIKCLSYYTVSLSPNIKLYLSKFDSETDQYVFVRFHFRAFKTYLDIKVLGQSSRVSKSYRYITQSFNKSLSRNLKLSPENWEP